MLQPVAAQIINETRNILNAGSFQSAGPLPIIELRRKRYPIRMPQERMVF